MQKVKNYWCQKVLPLVYDDSLSYYEILTKLTTKINEVIEYINDNFKELIKSKIDEYFNQLMVDAIYNESEETIYLKKEIIADGEHVYNGENKTIEIL